MALFSHHGPLSIATISRKLNNPTSERRQPSTTTLTERQIHQSSHACTPSLLTEFFCASKICIADRRGYRRATNPSVPSRSLPKPRSRTVRSRNGSVSEPEILSGPLATPPSPSLWTLELTSPFFEYYRYNAKRRHWRKTRIGI